MKISGLRTTKSYVAGDEVTVMISEIKETANGHLNMKLTIMDGKQPSNVFFYQTLGNPLGNGAYYFDLFKDAVGMPENIEADEQWFKGKTFKCVLADNTYEGKTNLTVGKYIKKETEEETDVPFQLPLSEDVEFHKEKPKTAEGKNTNGKTKNPDSPVRPNYTELLNE